LQIEASDLLRRVLSTVLFGTTPRLTFRSVVFGKLRRKMAKICVLLFGSAKDLCNGASEYQYEAPEDKVELCKVVDLMMEQYPKLRSLQGSFMMAVNCEYVDLQQPDLYVSSRDEIAIIPPVR
jgi:molybdopterin converting factor small subunit